MRLFIAILFKPPVLEEIITLQKQIKAHAFSGNFSRPSLLHLTLAFLGEVPKDDLSQVQVCMKEAAGEAFSLSFHRLDRFRRREGDLLYWSIVPSPGLMGLQRRLQESLRQKGLPFDEKSFRPHLTLGRQVVLTGGVSLDSVALPHLQTTVSSFVLMESKRVDGRLTYASLYAQALSLPMDTQEVQPCDLKC